MTPEEELVLANLKMLRDHQFAGMTATEKQKLDASVTAMENEYKVARKAADDKNQTKEDEKRNKEIVDAVTKNIPGIVKGALAAATAFEEGDNLTGSAAILDIASSAISLIAGVVPALGPAGAVFGALFSVIGQILTFFAPKPPSLLSQIDALLAKYGAMEKMGDIKAVGLSIEEYSAALQSQCKKIEKVLARTLKTEKQVATFAEDLDAINMTLKGAQTDFSVPKFENWKVAGWLTLTNNQDNELWPQVLGMWCEAWSKLLTANSILICMVNPAQLAAQLAVTDKSSDTPSIDPDTKKLAHSRLLKLQTIVGVARKAWLRTNKVGLGVVKDVSPVALERGLYSQVGDNECIYIAVGRAGLLPWDYKANTRYARSFYINVPDGQRGSLSPRYEMFLCTPTNRNGAGVHRHFLTPAKGDLGNGTEVLTQGRTYNGRYFSDCVDVCWIPSGDTPNGARVYTAHFETRPRAYSYVNIHTISADNQVTRVSWEPGGMLNGLDHIRVLYAPSSTVPGDPDGTDLPPVSKHGRYDILYGGYKSQSSIWVSNHNSWKEVPAPWKQYVGIEVDPDYMWVFGAEGLACATHASMIKAKEKGVAPRWITYAFKGTDFKKLFPRASAEERDRLAKKCKVTSISPCVDGTLAMGLEMDSRSICTANYEVKVTERTLVVNSITERGGVTDQVQKMPIPCWALYQSVKHDLELAQPDEDD